MRIWQGVLNSLDTVVELVLQADDYGMHPAITDGTDRLFDAGVVTQASVMPPAPDARRALARAARSGIPLGVHLTLACEWDFYRWSPLTQAPTLRAADGGFLPNLPDARPDTVEDARRELMAQVTEVLERWGHPTHMESHIRPFDDKVLTDLSTHFRLPSRDPLPQPGETMRLNSLWHLSVQHPATKLKALLEHVASLGPGRHMIVAHPAEDHDDLRQFCPPTSRRWKWARDIRITDSAALLSPDFVAWCRSSGVQLCATRDGKE